ncbi:hypothetical protein SLE2022_248320 [Rubroshorea leprosula]
MAVKEPVIFTEKDELRKWSRSMRTQGKTIGLVPTVGYLHQGHLSLVEEAHKHAEVVVVSIYVNPGQFSPSEDLSTYPSDFHGDILKLKYVPGGVDAVFAPKNLYDYRENKKSEIDVDVKDKNSCKKGVVATIVSKLFNIVEPDVAVFGKKDYQQWRIIQRMVRDLDFGVEIVGSDIVRDSDGLALSSRNVHLPLEEREKILNLTIPKQIILSLLKAKSDAKIGPVNCKEMTDTVVQTITQAGGRIDYAEIVKQESLEAVEEIKNPVVFCIAAWFGQVRLIDNIEISI